MNTQLKYMLIVSSLIILNSCKQEATKEPIRYSEIMNNLLKQEDTDGDKKITIEDKGPKKFDFINTKGTSSTIEGTYHLSNLLQELAILKEKDTIRLDRVKEMPSYRISRLIKTRYWDNLTRSIDKKGLEKVLGDTKSDVDTLRLYIPHQDSIAFRYFNELENEFSKLKVVKLPEEITPHFVKSINDKPGILNLAYTHKDQQVKGVPFVVPGGRFNEMYGWDSYFESVGLLIDGRADLAIAMAENFSYQIKHYGKILNANRSYYLTRTQPPFFSSLIKEIYEHNHQISKEWISDQLKMVIQEYENVWMQKDVRLTSTGLNRFYGEGVGIPPETEEGHFDVVLKKYADKHELDFNSFVEQYKDERIKDVELDQYFTHDRSMRESGHDTSNRLDAVCADLNTVGLNSSLYKYETDIAYLIKNVFEDNFTVANKKYNAAYWLSKAEQRKKLMNALMWNEQVGVFYDYNFVTKSQAQIESTTNYYPLWAGLCTEDQAASLVKNLFKNLMQKGGLAGTGDIADHSNPNAPQRQWDFPNGWAPHQMMMWRGLLNYGYEEEAQELIYRWLWTITKNAVDYNGTIPEKYDVVNCTHKVYAEYGNVGTEFDYITPSGFGWMNASYQLGISLINKELRSQLDQLTDPDSIFKE
ncbi:trehalase [Aquimarina algicola]|uniref:Trehalase n=2 Tax=Aquimarina algicola TaxID=2589995 RepID=A0A504J718_9FLAO|nr:trehalase [Aquimarina algicola]